MWETDSEKLSKFFTISMLLAPCTMAQEAQEYEEQPLPEMTPIQKLVDNQVEMSEQGIDFLDEILN